MIFDGFQQDPQGPSGNPDFVDQAPQRDGHEGESGGEGDDRDGRPSADDAQHGDHTEEQAHRTEHLHDPDEGEPLTEVVDLGAQQDIPFFQPVAVERPDECGKMEESVGERQEKQADRREQQSGRGNFESHHTQANRLEIAVESANWELRVNISLIPCVISRRRNFLK